MNEEFFRAIFIMLAMVVSIAIVGYIAWTLK